MAVDVRLADTLSTLLAQSSPEMWTALEITGTARDPGVAVVCAIRTDEKPGAGAPVPGLTLLRGRQRPALTALNPLSDNRLDAKPVRLSEDLLDQLQWPAGRAEVAPV